MPNDYERAVDALERMQRRLDALLESCVGIAVRHVRRDSLVASRAQLSHQRVPARAVMPVPVKQAKRSHRGNV